MTKDDISTIKRLWGDSSIVKDILGDVSRNLEDDKIDDVEALYHLRKVVRKNDEINEIIEKNFWRMEEKEMERIQIDRRWIRNEIREAFRIAHEAIINDPWCDSTESYYRATAIILNALKDWADNSNTSRNQ